MCNFFLKFICGKKSKVMAFKTDENKVNTVKELRIGKGSDYVSTNDCMVTNFGKASNTRVLMYAINWRNRINCVDENDSGNYEGGLLFDPTGYETPNMIRKTLNDGEPYLR